jgi:hypothetical protein
MRTDAPRLIEINAPIRKLLAALGLNVVACREVRGGLAVLEPPTTAAGEAWVSFIRS